MIPIDEQLSRFQANSEQAHDLMRAFIYTNREVISRAAERRVAGVGLDEYGDAAWHKEPEALGAEAVAEFADALFYLAVAVERVGFVAALRMLTGLDAEDVA